jgi:hypothetical protein
MATRLRKPGKFCWINMLTPRPAEAMEFFAAVLGWTYFEMTGIGHGMRVGGRDIGGLFGLEGPNTPPGLPTECLSKDRDVLLAFYDFPAEHWLHIRTTNPIESVFATVRLRHDKTKGNGSRTACLTMVFKLMESASKGWRSLNGSPLLAEVVKGTRFIDGVNEKPAA